MFVGFLVTVPSQIRMHRLSAWQGRGATIAMVHDCHHIHGSAPFQLSLPPSDHCVSEVNAFYAAMTYTGQVATDGWNG